ncbi:MAG: hypothetical protein HC786_21375 [Richelia sp. CSU_2_1]|nr:hypothetical protein [Richelia sp. CSU_2_1]
MDNQLSPIASIFEEIQLERKRQDGKFGSQPRSLKPVFYLAVLVEELGEVARAIIEGDSENYREEVVQLAAVAVATVEDFDGGQAIGQIETVCPAIQYSTKVEYTFF